MSSQTPDIVIANQEIRPFFAPKSALPCFEKPAHGPYPESDESILLPHTTLL
jgi:hypothetical protein